MYIRIVRFEILLACLLFVVWALVLCTGLSVLYHGTIRAERSQDFFKVSALMLHDQSHEKEVLLNRVPVKSRKILLAVGVLNRLNKAKRRDVIRFTWFQHCKRDNIQCKFFTDDTQNTTEKQIYERENDENGDMLFMPIKGGHNFAQRLVWMLKWYTKHYDFDYFLRVDDDYFICMERLMYELPHRPRNGLYWGYTHCTPNVVRVDEGWMMLSRDIIDEALNKYNSTLLCHPFGDQAVALWIQESALNITWFSDNRRLVHSATAYAIKKYLKDNLCERYLALHGSYQLEMLKYWSFAKRYSIRKNNGISSKNNNINQQFEIPRILKIESVCKKNRTFSVNGFWPHVRFQPKLCKDNPTWRNTHEKFIGREDYGQDMIF